MQGLNKIKVNLILNKVEAKKLNKTLMLFSITYVFTNSCISHIGMNSLTADS